MLVSIVTYQIYEHYTISTEPAGNVVYLGWGALVVSTITFVLADEWDACEQAKACPHAEDEGWGEGSDQ
ncbi:hypothetical protein [uncultured Thiothrix sp.]|uniref:hypothetical protein n=1 Tax=uncultured Thiothrix sp. TaxID=223185 RepID=UPI0026371393|nr:hypothetical protein [uncultured Thiothrix sp.]